MASKQLNSEKDQDLIEYLGSCHCGKVKFEVWAPKKLKVLQCNCSICLKKQIKAFLVPPSNFKLVSSDGDDKGKNGELISTYTFNTGQAKHTFCSKCGVQSYYFPRCSSHEIAILPHCIDSPLPLNMTVEDFDGKAEF